MEISETTEQMEKSKFPPMESYRLTKMANVKATRVKDLIKAESIAFPSLIDPEKRESKFTVIPYDDTIAPFEIEQMNTVPTRGDYFVVDEDTGKFLFMPAFLFEMDYVSVENPDKGQETT